MLHLPLLLFNSIVCLSRLLTHFIEHFLPVPEMFLHNAGRYEEFTYPLLLQVKKISVVQH